MKRYIAISSTLLALVLVVAQAAAADKSTGWISDDMCGAKHAGSGADCAKKCISGGMKPVFVDSKKQVWNIDNPDAVKDYYGGKVAVTATENTDKRTMHIQSIVAAR